MNNSYLYKQAKSPLHNIGKGALIGSGVGALIDFILNNKKREKENYRWWYRPLVYAALGSTPGLIQAITNYTYSYDQNKHFDNLDPHYDTKLSILDPLLLDAKDLAKKSDVYSNNMQNAIETMRLDINPQDYDNAHKPERSLTEKYSSVKLAHLYKRALGWNDPNIPVSAFNQSIFNTPGMNQNAITNIPNTLNATQTITNAPWVSPAQVAGTLVNAGIGAATGAVIGKTIGALCGISPQTYNTIKNMGMYAGMMNTMGNAITGRY